jgi:Fur family zinc uptake transcriptional regulator
MASRHSERVLTRNQRAVLDCLKEAGRPLTAYQLLDKLRTQGIAAPPTVYRALDRLMALHHVHRIESLNAYVVCCAQGHANDVVFVICRDCGNVMEIDAEPASADLKSEALRSGFTVEEAHIELVGTCVACRAAG